MSDIKKQLEDLEQRKKELEVTEYKLLEKAFRSEDVTDIVKAQGYYQQLADRIKGGKTQSKSLLFDPHQVVSSGRWVEKPIQVSYGMLRAMSKTPIPRAIITTRKDQIAEFAAPQQDRFSTGFIIRPKKSGTQWDDEKELTDKQKKEIDQIIEFVLNCGEDSNAWHGDSFEQFLRKTTEDSLSLDQLTYEIVRNRGKRPVEFFATDAATYRLADTIDLEQQGVEKVNGYYPAYVQLYQNNVWAHFYPWELCFGVRNPQTDINFNGYGRSELEDLISTVTSMLYADQYNSNFFRVGSNPKGILRVTGNVSEPRLQEFRQSWMAQITGVQNSHRVPVVEADKMEWVSTQLPNKDMEFSKYQEYLIRIACAIFKISPVEIGFHIEGENSGGMGNRNNKDELVYSKDKGLKPLLRFHQRKLNKMVIDPYCEANNLSTKYELVFVGIDIETEQEEEERLIKAVGGPYMEINEARRKKGLEEKPDYDIIQSPVLASMKQAQMFGDQESNAFMDDEEEEAYKSEGNPMMKGLQVFWDKLANEDK